MIGTVSIYSFSPSQVDAILFLDVRALLHTMYKRMQAWRAYRLAAHNLRHSFPDASPQQLRDNAEGCAICKDAMQVACALYPGRYRLQYEVLCVYIPHALTGPRHQS